MKLSLITRLLAAVALPILVVVIAFTAGRPIGKPTAQKEESDRFEAPAQRFIENLPATENLPRSTNRGASVPAFKTPALTLGPTWTALGPFPIPNGQTQNRVDPVSGRVSAIAIHPTNPL